MISRQQPRVPSIGTAVGYPFSSTLWQPIQIHRQNIHIYILLHEFHEFRTAMRPAPTSRADLVGSIRRKKQPPGRAEIHDGLRSLRQPAKSARNATYTDPGISAHGASA